MATVETQIEPSAAADTKPSSAHSSLPRFQGLDVLRFVAVTLVLHIHGVLGLPLFDRGNSGPLAPLSPFGDKGVDLFFVLSGFLVSGLLFQEFVARRTVSTGRFFARRAFKIYPAFWALIAVTVILRFCQTHQINFSGIFAELFFYQNYVDGLWTHTWSLAVEEHFYLLLIVIFFALKTMARRTGKLNIHVMPRIFEAVLIVCMVSRVLTWWYRWRLAQVVDPLRWTNWVTHLRIDALFFGMWIAYWWHFRWNAEIKSRLLRAKYLFLFVGVILISPLPEKLIYEDLWHVIHFVVVYLGGGCLLLASLSLKATNGMLSWCAWLGRHSYSVYLWHMLVLEWCKPLVAAQMSLSASFGVEAIYHAASWTFGIVTARLIEFPCLRLRDKLFPAKA